MKMKENLIKLPYFFLVIFMVLGIFSTKSFASSDTNNTEIYLDISGEDIKEKDFKLVLWKVDKEFSDDNSKLEFLKDIDNKDVDYLYENYTDNYEISSITFDNEDQNTYIVFNSDKLAKGSYYVRSFYKNEGEDIYNPLNYSFILILPQAEKIYPKKVGNDYPKETEIILEKLDEDNEENKLSGAYFKLYRIKKDDNGNEIEEPVKTKDYSYDENGKEEELVTNSQGIIKIKNLPVNDDLYFFKEIKAPQDYEIIGDGKSQKVGISSKVKVYNRKVTRGYKKFVKVDSTDNTKTLEGAEFNLYRQDDDKFIKSLKSDSKGEFEVRNLDYGKYYLREVKAPKGYLLQGNKIEFEISKQDQDDVVQTRIIENKPTNPPGDNPNRKDSSKKITIPKTGDIAIILMIIMGFVLIVFGLKFILEKDKKNT
ncbi:SpaA isopeptide-forming pilin-related protein [Anaerococcus sp. AGMB09787]|uniref:MSCRAMM family protein n=1 Tax=Anaerococcus sp. AGMB09787 TaxID=2922869 RepID=UPI001FAEEFD4|nr:SpaA isopeptide-forming pilin-related protein [Anaerococcus sp. AGMB09787]